MTDEEAEILIKKELNLPKKFNEEINANSNDPLGEGAKCYSLEKAGYVYTTGNWIYGYNLYTTAKGKPYLIGEGKDSWSGKNTLKFKAFDIDFDKVTGIALNKETQIATVRFTLKAINISPISLAIDKDFDSIKNGELEFKKFDKSWQLSNNSSKTGTDLLKEIWWAKKQ